MPRKTSNARKTSPSCLSFNEAAARCRGKLAPRGTADLIDQASMRPRPDAAENPGWSPASAARSGGGFNEAAARCRGKRTVLREG